MAGGAPWFWGGFPMETFNTDCVVHAVSSTSCWTLTLTRSVAVRSDRQSDTTSATTCSTTTSALWRSSCRSTRPWIESRPMRRNATSPCVVASTRCCCRRWRQSTRIREFLRKTERILFCYTFELWHIEVLAVCKVQTETWVSPYNHSGTNRVGYQQSKLVYCPKFTWTHAVRNLPVSTLISRATAPEQPVEWACSPKMAKWIFTNFKNVIKFAIFNEFQNWKPRILELWCSLLWKGEFMGLTLPSWTFFQKKSSSLVLY